MNVIELLIFQLLPMQSICSSDVLLDRLGRISHADHAQCYCLSSGVGLIGYYNDLFFARGEPK
jgi:hypothetical protein